MRIIRAAQHKTVPWKNGGGTATAIAEHPPGAGFDSFDWRLSGAHVGRDGPFSLFPHVDRTMFILRGKALHLHGLGSAPVVLTPSSAPFRFPGDVAVSATLPDGPIDDLNIMTDRRRFSHKAQRLVEGHHPLIVNDTVLIFAEAGPVIVVCDDQRAQLVTWDCIVAESAMDVLVDAGAVAIAITFTPLEDGQSG